MSGTQAAICAKLSSEAGGPFDAQDRDAVAAFYSGRDCRPLWVDEKGPTRAAELAIAELGHADDWGLNSSDFQLNAVNQPMTLRPVAGDQTADAELEITAAILRYAHQAQGGRIPEPDKLLSSYLDRQPDAIERRRYPRRKFRRPRIPTRSCGRFNRQQDQFLKLKALLATLRGKQQNVSPKSWRLRGADRCFNSVRKCRGRPVEEALRRCVGSGRRDGVRSGARQGHQDISGIRLVGRPTASSGRQRVPRSSGDAPEKNSDKITAVIANMEEWRWMPRTLGATHILVNVPSFSIVLTDKDKPVFEDRVVVGTAEKQTPIFSKEMKTIVLRPQWNLPDSIKLTALALRPIDRTAGLYRHAQRPRRRQLARELGKGQSERLYRFYQPSGDDNALGLVKFLFPNKHSVYLHDTPARYLFNDPVRLYSHGCMRVRNPQVLAQQILDIDRGAAAPDVKQLVRKGPMDNEFTLDTPIPVHVGYFTVWVGDRRPSRNITGTTTAISNASRWRSRINGTKSMSAKIIWPRSIPRR